MKNMRWAACKCWLYENIFIPQLNVHLRFEEYPDFIQSYSKFFADSGWSTLDLEFAYKTAETEHLRRKEADIKALENKVNNLHNLGSLVRVPFILKENDFLESFCQLRQYANNKEILTEDMLSIAHEFEGVNEVYGFPALSATCLARINAELDRFRAQGGLTIQPNTMNRSGILLGEIPGSQAYCENSTHIADVGGADIDLMSSLFQAGLQSILARLFPDVGPTIDSYRVFTVEYVGLSESCEKNPKDYDLSPHYDNSEVLSPVHLKYRVDFSHYELTINICLDFERDTEHDVGGQLFFCHFSPHNNTAWDRERDGFAQLLDHRPGWAIIHRGSHVHGVLPFNRPSDKTRRRSLICWLRSSRERATQCPRCFKQPQLYPMPVWYRGRMIDCTSLSPEAVEKNDYVRVGYGDGFVMPPFESACHVV